MVIFKAFFDEAGIHGSAQWSVAAGYISTIDRWDKFTVKWLRTLKPFGLASFHMTDCESLATWHTRTNNGQKPLSDPVQTVYANLGIEGRERLVSLLSAIVAENTDMGVGTLIPKQAYDALVIPIAKKAQYTQANADKAYPMCSIGAVNGVSFFAGVRGIPHSDIEIMFAETSAGNEMQKRTIRQMCEMRGFPEPTWRPIADFPPLQSGDMLAWALAHYGGDLKAKWRDRHHALRHDVAVQPVERHKIENIAEWMVGYIDRNFKDGRLPKKRKPTR